MSCINHLVKSTGQPLECSVFADCYLLHRIGQRIKSIGINQKNQLRILLAFLQVTQTPDSRSSFPGGSHGPDFGNKPVSPPFFLVSPDNYLFSLNKCKNEKSLSSTGPRLFFQIEYFIPGKHCVFHTFFHIRHPVKDLITSARNRARNRWRFLRAQKTPASPAKKHLQKYQTPKTHPTPHPTENVCPFCLRLRVRKRRGSRWSCSSVPTCEPDRGIETDQGAPLARGEETKRQESLCGPK